MKKDDKKTPPHQRWAEFRFSVIGGLLASPPSKGDLQMEIKNLSQKKWKHPISGELTLFGFSTIEGWYYQARNEKLYPVEVLRTKIRSDVGQFKSIDQTTKDCIVKQYLNHKAWSYKLHADNIKAVIGDDSPSYWTIRRFMKGRGFLKRRRMKKKYFSSDLVDSFEKKETRSFENEYTNGLWHADFHHCSQQIVTKDGKWETPTVVAILDDHSRLACHVQWYLSENTKNLVHSFLQAVLKRGLPRSFLSDNGSSFVSKEFTQGASRLGIQILNTLPYHPNQNGKQERFFGTLEKRLMDMLENKKDLTLKELNDYTIVWVEKEYNRSPHDEIKCSPVERFSKDKDVGRPSPTLKEMQACFGREETRRQRRTDGTISLNGKRYEIPNRYLVLESICVRYAEWDLSLVHMVDSRTGKILERIFPIDKIKNANQGRKIISDDIVNGDGKEDGKNDGKNKGVGDKNSETDSKTAESKDEIAPLLKKYMEEYKASGLPIPYLPQDENL